MVKGIWIAFAVLVYSFLPGVTGIANAKTTSITTTSVNTSCALPSYTLFSNLKTARLTTDSNGSSLFVPPIFTSAKETNGSLSASIGMSVADPEAPIEEAITPEPTVVSLPSITPVPTDQNITAQSASGGLNAEVLFNMVNAHRVNIGLPAFQKDVNVCSIAGSRAPELHNEIYVTHNMHAGFRARSLPYWATENMISQKTEADALNWWLNSPVHRSAIVGNYSHACTACQGDSCNMIFTSFVAKG